MVGSPLSFGRQATRVLAVAVFLVLVLPVFVLVIPVGSAVGQALAALVWLAALAYCVFALLRSGENEGSVWDHVPRWQYEGRHAESGGIARGEQESALNDVRAQAAERQAGERYRH